MHVQWRKEAKRSRITDINPTLTSQQLFFINCVWWVCFSGGQTHVLLMEFHYYYLGNKTQVEHAKHIIRFKYYDVSVMNPKQRAVYATRIVRHDDTIRIHCDTITTSSLSAWSLLQCADKNVPRINGPKYLPSVSYQQ